MQKQIAFKIIGIRTVQFAILEDNFDEKKKNQIITDLEFDINKECHQINVQTSFTFKAANKPFIILQVRCSYKASEDSWKNCIFENSIIFPKDFMTHIAMMTIGTARGILHSKTEGSLFNRIILPTINVTELVIEDIRFDFQE